MLKSWGMEVEERPIDIDELFASARSGALEEAFGTGTAAVVSPIGEFNYNGEIVSVAEGEIGPVSQKLYDELTGIQWGEREDPYGWTMEV